MVEMFIIAGISGLLAAIIGALIALGIQRRSLDKIHARNQAWERAQERMRSRLPTTAWSSLLAALPDLTRLADEA